MLLEDFMKKIILDRYEELAKLEEESKKKASIHIDEYSQAFLSILTKSSKEVKKLYPDMDRLDCFAQLNLIYCKIKESNKNEQ